MIFSVGVLADITGIHLILSSQEILSPMLWIASGIIGIFQSMLVDRILFIRLVSVYPLRRVGPGRFALVSGLPILLKVVRVINVIIFLKLISDLVHRCGMDALQAYFALPYPKIEWVAQVVDNTSSSYVSIMFLRTVHGRGTPNECFTGSGIAIRCKES
ncbi:hypothetical protein OG21DRAFT_584478 [Imleria badia]|nr:hypothetical protein OG21DRAFT_584478 [Imleria badia]